MLVVTRRGGLAAVSWGAMMLVGSLFLGRAQAADNRTYTGGRFALQLDGVDVGYVRAFEGGGAVADVVVENVGAAPFPKKHISNVRYQDIVLEVGLDAGLPLYQWIADALEGKDVRKSGSVVTLDFDYKAVEVLRFERALLSEVTFAPADAQSKERGVITLRLAPESTRVEQGAGAVAKLAATGAKAWISSNFRLELAGIDTSRVAKVDGLSVTWRVDRESAGAARELARESVAMSIANLRVTMSAAGAADMMAWHKSFVIEGKARDGDEKQAALVWLSADLKTELARLTFSNVGVVRAERARAEENAAQASRVEAELYSERVGFSMPGMAAAAKPLVRTRAVP